MLEQKETSAIYCESRDFHHYVHVIPTPESEDSLKEVHNHVKPQ